MEEKLEMYKNGYVTFALKSLDSITTKKGLEIDFVEFIKIE